MSSYSEKKSSCEKEREANIRRNEKLLRRFGKLKPTFQQKKQDVSSDSESESDQDWNPNEDTKVKLTEMKLILKQVPYAPGLEKAKKRKFHSSRNKHNSKKRIRIREDFLSFGNAKERKIKILKVKKPVDYTEEPVDYTEEELSTEDCYIYCEECDELHFGNCPVYAELEPLNETEMKTDSMSTTPIPKQLSMKGDSYAKQLGIDNSESDDGNKEEKAIKESPVRRSVYRTQKDKAFKCQQCSCSYQYKYSLTSHTRIHTGMKLHTCNSCQKFFINESKLSRHALTHTGEKPFKCRVCNRRFADPSNRNSHERTHKANH